LIPEPTVRYAYVRFMNSSADTRGNSTCKADSALPSSFPGRVGRADPELLPVVGPDVSTFYTRPEIAKIKYWWISCAYVHSVCEVGYCIKSKMQACGVIEHLSRSWWRVPSWPEGYDGSEVGIALHLFKDCTCRLAKNKLFSLGVPPCC